MSACSRLVSWYSSTRTWSKASARAGPRAASVAAARQYEQEIVEVEQVLRSACGRCRPRRSAPISRLVVVATQGNERRSTVVERAPGVGDARVDGDAGSPCGGTGGRSSAATGADLVAGQLHQVGGVALVEDAEAVAQAESGRRAGAAAGGRRSGTSRPRTCRASAGSTRWPSPPDHLVRGPPAEGHQQRSARGATPSSRSRASRATSVRVLPVPAPATMSKRPIVVLDGPPLHRVQSGRPGLFHQTDDSALPEHMFGCAAGRTATPR